MLNARVETVDERPAFRSAFTSRRCLVPADGWIEWQREGKARLPFYVRRADREPLLFAGLWERWRDRSDRTGDWLHTFTILTRESRGAVAELHPRMPLLVGPAARARWLVPGDDPRADILAEPLPDLTLTAVDTRVNDARNDDPACLAPRSSA